MSMCMRRKIWLFMLLHMLMLNLVEGQIFAPVAQLEERLASNQ